MGTQCYARPRSFHSSFADSFEHAACSGFFIRDHINLASCSLPNLIWKVPRRYVCKLYERLNILYTNLSVHSGNTFPEMRFPLLPHKRSVQFWNSFPEILNFMWEWKTLPKHHCEFGNVTQRKLVTAAKPRFGTIAQALALPPTSRPLSSSLLVFFHHAVSSKHPKPCGPKSHKRLGPHFLVLFSNSCYLGSVSLLGVFGENRSQAREVLTSVFALRLNLGSVPGSNHSSFSCAKRLKKLRNITFYGQRAGASWQTYPPKL